MQKNFVKSTNKKNVNISAGGFKPNLQTLLTTILMLMLLQFWWR